MGAEIHIINVNWYNQSENVLFALPPLDTAADDEKDAIAGGRHGVHTALVAGQIIAGNAFDDAFLSYDRNGEQPVQMAREGVLTRGEYYLQVPPQSSTPYAITPNFEEWRFPHGRLPGSWASLEGTYHGVTRTEMMAKRCVISAAGPSTVDTAHVIPQSDFPGSMDSTEGGM
ncbi:hypothetical protein G6O67_005595 [Ophiocordyceps sinensis]|uniref:HNH nuclease domain-containing protein n=1 Tax=Ophiocordyceps sinensis TaxID=72228 RepID=A0A8H4V6C0_9HYPO|nr:hypothetical protein G6O67_005595 [Ophiocordyceps sinensis]